MVIVAVQELPDLLMRMLVDMEVDVSTAAFYRPGEKLYSLIDRHGQAIAVVPEICQYLEHLEHVWCF